MPHTRIWAAAGIIACIVIIGFALSVPHTRDVATTAATTAAPVTPTVSLHDSYKKGTHTIQGSIEAPDACAAATATASVVGDASSTQTIVVAVALPQTEGACLQVPTASPFKVTVSAPGNLPIEATVNGVAASTTAL